MNQVGTGSGLDLFTLGLACLCTGGAAAVIGLFQFVMRFCHGNGSVKNGSRVICWSRSLAKAAFRRKSGPSAIRRVPANWVGPANRGESPTRLETPLGLKRRTVGQDEKPTSGSSEPRRGRSGQSLAIRARSRPADEQSAVRLEDEPRSIDGTIAGRKNGRDPHFEPTVARCC